MKIPHVGTLQRVAQWRLHWNPATGNAHIKHVATVEARYFGEVFDRPSPEPLPRWQDSDGSDLWATEDETRDQIVGFYRRTWKHSDATIDALPLDAPGHVPWWPEPHADTNLFAVMVHVLGESIRHAGHADILREGLDGRTGLRAESGGAHRDRRGSTCGLPREDRAGRQVGRTGQGLEAAYVHSCLRVFVSSCLRGATPVTIRSEERHPTSRTPLSQSQPEPLKWALVSPSPEQVMRHAARAGHDLQVVPVEQLVGGLPEA